LPGSSSLPEGTRYFFSELALSINNGQRIFGQPSPVVDRASFAEWAARIADWEIGAGASAK
jgi:hypothetical protein